MTICSAPHRSRRSAMSALVALVMMTGCGDSDSTSTDDGVRVVAAFYPLEEIVRGVGGDHVVITDLTPTGSGPHDLELQPTSVTAIAEADLVVYLGRGFQPQVEDAIDQAPPSVTPLDLLDTVDVLTVDEQLDGTAGEVDGEVLDGDVDPHVWLDPSRMLTMVDAVTDALVDLDPDHAEEYRSNAATYRAQLVGLDDEYATGLASCRSRVIVTSHRAFGYLADTYDLGQIPIAGVSPEVEPDPSTLAAIAAEAEAEGVTTIFLESIAPPDLAETIAAEIGAALDLLDPIEGLTDEQLDAGETYASIMRDNLGRLRRGLGCT